uniref:Uncharacterized protein n=1 Tax=Chromera velia CCMP2878 TaxID=1169474 RepID=A0A0G4HEM4_9ALVE|eukprot:Cvel_26634.t1-p1 / transcript=Cvel_26634.t1 / gene=Cvel_26634 / organism=Chromera_velia_CCMP2878 / gene_product=hypothetical protein / transcript_product=hypothetical protein / location=Cvel_scaffold3200:9476-12665(-) / protein_length=479 / sequence_SO=supercontig / SO=protein_coding / is_pseudo=false
MLSTLEKEKQAHAEGRARVRDYWENMSGYRAHQEFRKLPGEGEECPDCRCYGQSVRACNRRWEGVLKMERGTINHYYGFGWVGMVGFGCAMDVLLETSRAKHHTDLTLYWAHVVNIFALMKGPEVARYVAMGGRLKPRQEMEKRFPAVYLFVKEVVQLMTESREDKWGFPLRARIYALSYSWHSAEHPDPTGSTAKTVMEGLENNGFADSKSFVRAGREEGDSLFSMQRGGKREKKEGEEDEETWMEKDFQRTSNNTLPENTISFPIYFQDFTKLEGVTNKAPYHKHGWTNFESRVARVKDEDQTIHLGPFTGTLEQIPLSPPAFQRLLEEKKPEERSDDNKEGFVVRFTNGKEDRPLVANLYRDFMLDTQGRGEMTIIIWSKYQAESDTKEKGEMLGEYFAWMGEQPECEVEEVYLRECHLNDHSLPRVAAGLGALSSLQELDLRGNKFGLSSLSALTCLRQLKSGLRLIDSSFTVSQ